jgi:glutaconate CoA-transferase subunit B
LSADHTTDELVACVIARQIRDGERGFLGANMSVGRDAVLVAHRLWAPNLRLLLGFSWASGTDRGTLHLHEDSADFRDSRWAEGWMRLDSMIDEYRFFSDFMVIGALQIDRFGNSNLIGLGDDHAALRFRGPGPMGSLSTTAYCDRFYLAPTRHDPGVFVESCDFISAVGWGAGGPDGRERLGLAGGPHLVVTPRCVFDFTPDTRSLRLRSVHPGGTVAEVLDQTGCEVVVEEVSETEPPTAAELEVLRGHRGTPVPEPRKGAHG